MANRRLAATATGCGRANAIRHSQHVVSLLSLRDDLMTDIDQRLAGEDDFSPGQEGYRAPDALLGQGELAGTRRDHSDGQVAPECGKRTPGNGLSKGWYEENRQARRRSSAPAVEAGCATARQRSLRSRSILQTIGALAARGVA